MIYFDNAATSFPKPSAVTKEVVRCLDTYCGNPGRSSHRLALLAAEKIYDCRCKIAELVKINSPESVVFTYNATYALNFAIYSLAEENMHILISDMEHNSVYRPVYKLKKEGKCDYDVFKTDGNIIENLTSLLRNNTKLLVCTHISNVSGRVLPIKEISNFCQENGICFILDASQSAGHIDININELGCDVLCAPGHKGLFGIQGSGFAIFKNKEKIKELVVGGSGINSLSPLMPQNLPERLEAGTLSTPAIASLCAGIDYIQDVGINQIEEREAVLRYLLLERLTAIDTLNLLDLDKKCSNVISFSCEKILPEKLGALLDRSGICVRSGFHCSPLAHKALGTFEKGTVRISLGYFNTINEIDTFYKKIKEIIKENQ